MLQNLFRSVRSIRPSQQEPCTFHLGKQNDVQVIALVTVVLRRCQLTGTVTKALSTYKRDWLAFSKLVSGNLALIIFKVKC